MKARDTNKVAGARSRLKRDPDRPGRSVGWFAVWLLVAAVGANVLNGVLLIKTRLEAGDTARCIAVYNQQFSEAYRARVASSDDAMKALDRIVAAVEERDPVELRQSVAEYLAFREKVQHDQRTNPYPPLPTQLCGPEVTKK